MIILECLKTFHDVADYITINISSPNTEDLRSFHDQTKLNELLKNDRKRKKILKFKNTNCSKNITRY